MPTDIDARLAGQVRGWKRGQDPRSSRAYPVDCWFDERNRMRGQNPPDFANDNAAAFMLLGALRKDHGEEWVLCSTADPERYSCELIDHPDIDTDCVGIAAAITAAVLAWLDDRETTDGK